MKALTIILLMIVSVLVLTSLATLVYIAYFRHVLNKRVAEGKTGAGRLILIEPLKFFLISFLVLMLLGFGVLMLSAFQTANDEVVFEACDDSPLALISPYEEIPGYRRYLKSDEGVELVWYVKDSDNKSFPDILIHVEAGEDYEYSFSSDGTELEKTGKSDEKSG